MWYKGKAGVRGVAVMGSISKWVAFLCLLLILCSAVAVVTHHHSDACESVKCTICVAAHSASPTLPVLSLRTTFLALATFRAEPVVSTKQRLIAFALTVRPPPQV